jgi:hypothetical protein
MDAFLLCKILLFLNGDCPENKVNYDTTNKQSYQFLRSRCLWEWCWSENWFGSVRAGTQCWKTPEKLYSGPRAS